MASRYRRRGGRRGESGNAQFGVTGWLFADLLLAIAAVFLLATTVGIALPSAKPKPHPTATPAPTPKPSATRVPVPALQLSYVDVKLTINPSSVSAASIRKAISGNSQLSGRQAGLVMLFGGGDVNSSQWRQLDSKVWSILRGMDPQSPLFRVAVSRQFWGGGSVTTIELNIYLFKQQS